MTTEAKNQKMDHSQEYIEYICDPVNEQHSFLPRRHKELDQQYEDSISSNWRAEEVPLGKDYYDFQTFSEAEKNIVLVIHQFFSVADGLVICNVGNFLEEIKIREAKDFMCQQLQIETIHNKTYSLIINHLTKDNPELQDKILDSIKHFPVIQKISTWFDKYANADKHPINARLFAQVLSEGLLFSGCFAALYWIREFKKGLLTGVTKANEFISKDEAMHATFFATLYKMLRYPLSDVQAEEILREGVNYSIEFINEAINVPVLGLNAKDMGQYIKFVADDLMLQCGHSKVYNVKNPFPWMIFKALQAKTNFHEKVVSEYSAASESTVGYDDDY